MVSCGAAIAGQAIAGQAGAEAAFDGGDRAWASAPQGDRCDHRSHGVGTPDAITDHMRHGPVITDYITTT